MKWISAKLSKIALTTILAGSLFACSELPSNDSAMTNSDGGVIGYAQASLMQVGQAVSILFNAGSAESGSTLDAVQPEQAVIKKGGGIVFRVGDYITVAIPSYDIFVPGKAELSLSANDYLAAAAGIINAYPQTDVLVTANEAGLLSKKQDIILSNAQAKAFITALQQHKIDSQEGSRNLYYVGLGNSHTVANGKYASGITANRRIQITLFPNKDLERNQNPRKERTFKIDAY